MSVRPYEDFLDLNEVEVMDEDAAEQLAFDVACGFFNDEQLCVRYGLALDVLEDIKQQGPFLALVDENRRLLEDDGSEFLIKAKKYAGDALDVLHDLANDEDMSGTVRQKSAVSLLEYARVRTGSKVEEGNKVAPIIINTNLNLGTEKKGVYRIEAAPGPRPVQGRVIEVGEERRLANNEDLLG